MSVRFFKISKVLHCYSFFNKDIFKLNTQYVDDLEFTKKGDPSA